MAFVRYESKGFCIGPYVLILGKKHHRSAVVGGSMQPAKKQTRAKEIKKEQYEKLCLRTEREVREAKEEFMSLFDKLLLAPC